MGPAQTPAKLFINITFHIRNMNKALLPITTLVGTIMGAGFLGLPYVAQKSGIAIALFWLVIIGAGMAFIMLGLGEVILRTKQKHQLTGYAELYLGARGKKLMMFAMLIGIYAALLAYLLGESQSLSFILTGSFKQSITFGLIFWGCVSLATYKGINVVKKGEFFGVALVLVLLAGIIILAFPEIKPQNLETMNLQNWSVPIGLVLFSMLGYSALPEARQLQGKNASKLRRSIIISYIIAVIFYALFIITIVGALGENTPEIATLALGRWFAVIGVITMLTAYLALATALIDMFRYDYGWKKNQAWAITSAIPLMLFAAVSITKIATFTTILELGGLISGGLSLVMILLMMQKAKQKGNRKPEYTVPIIKGIAPLVALLLIIATMIQIISLFR